MAGLQQRSPALRRPAVQGEDLPHDAGTGEQHGHHRVGQGGQRTAHRMNRPRRDLVLPVLVPRHGRRLRRPGRSSGSGFASWMSPWAPCHAWSPGCRPRDDHHLRLSPGAVPASGRGPPPSSRPPRLHERDTGRTGGSCTGACHLSDQPALEADGSTVRAALPAGFLMMSMSCPSLPRSSCATRSGGPPRRHAWDETVPQGRGDAVRDPPSVISRLPRAPALTVSVQST